MFSTRVATLYFTSVGLIHRFKIKGKKDQHSTKLCGLYQMQAENLGFRFQKLTFTKPIKELF